MEKIALQKSKELNYDQFVQEVVLGKLASDVYNEGKKIVPLRHVGVRKSRLIARPQEAAAGVGTPTHAVDEKPAEGLPEEAEGKEEDGESGRTEAPRRSAG